MHAYTVRAEDAAGNDVELSGTFELDPTAPLLTATGSLPDSAGEELPTGSVQAAIAATDSQAGDSGVSELAALVDERPDFSDPTDCSSGCPSQASSVYTYDPQAHSDDSHTVTLIAEDAAGNQARTSYVVDVTEPPPAGECVESTPTVQDPVDTATTTEAAAAAPEAATDESSAGTVTETGEELHPLLQESEDPAEPLDVVGSLSYDHVASDPASGFTSGRLLEMVPLQTTASETDPEIGEGEAAVYANSAAETDTIVRPAAAGLTVVESLRGSASPESFEWKVCLRPGLELEELDDGGIAVVDPAQTPDPNVVVPPLPADAMDVTELSDTALQLEIAEHVTASAEHETGQAVVAVLALPYTVDWSASPSQPATLELTGTDLVTLDTPADTRWALFSVVANPKRANAPKAVPLQFTTATNAAALKNQLSNGACKFARSQSTSATEPMIFHFGKGDKRNGSFGIEQPNGTFFTNGQVLNALKDASVAYRNDSPCYEGGNGFIGYGTTSNFPSSLPDSTVQELGRKQARTARELRAWIKQSPHNDHQGVMVAGDIEATWNPPGITKKYVAAAKREWIGPYANYGNAGGCPPENDSHPATCLNGWGQLDHGEVSWGLGGVALPEVYTPLEAKQWQRILHDWRQQPGQGDTVFLGVTSCPKSPCNSTYSPSQSWEALHDRTNGRVRRHLLNFKEAPSG